MVATLDGAWRASHDGETIDAASKKPDFLARFSAFIKSADQLPGEKLAEFDDAIQTMANNGCEKIQAYINSIFKVNVEKANANDAGSLVNLLLDNFDAMQGVFSMADGLKVYAAAKLIARNELGQYLWSSKEAVMAAMKKDAKDTAADTDTSSYRIDIGV